MATPRDTNEPIEELFENRPTDVEAEEEGDAPQDTDVSRPYAPSLIRVDPKMFSLRNILDMIYEQDLDLAPDFQRLKVWKSWQKSRLIESILLRIPLPAFYFSSDADGRLLVVDGVQRLTTIYDFVRGGHDGNSYFKLTELEYLQEEVGEKTFKDLEGTSWAKRLHSTQIIANVIDPQTPTAVKFDIFRRINTGGTPLTAQEIRHCMSGSTSRRLLKNLADSEAFKRATSGRLSGHPRMADREMVLRVLAFNILGDFDKFSSIRSLEELLNSATEQIDNHLSKEQIAMLEARFLRSMTLAYDLFGSYAFRKWPTNQYRLSPINRALFEVWGVVLSEVEPQRVTSSKSLLIEKFRSLFDLDPFFVSAISTGTGDPKKILYRFGVIRQLLAECVK